MKRKYNLIQAKMLSVFLSLALPLMVQAQFTYTANGGGYTITTYLGAGGAVTIPSLHNSLPVTSIGDNIFNNNSSVTSVVIPNSITNIGNNAFNTCNSLTNVVMSGNVITIGNNAFSWCGKLTSIVIGNAVTAIQSGTLYNCSKLSRVVIGNHVNRIDDTAFYGCSSLTTLTIPGSVTNLAYQAFAGDISLNSVYFQGNAPGLGANVFSFNGTTIYYLPGTTNWGATFAGLTTVSWNVQAQTGDTSFGVRTNRFGFKITGTSGLSFVVEACTNFAAPVWQSVQTNTLTNGFFYFSDSNWTNYPARYYHIGSP